MNTISPILGKYWIWEFGGVSDCPANSNSYNSCTANRTNTTLIS